MRKLNGEKPTDYWFVTSDAQRVFGLTGPGFAKSVKPLVPQDAIAAEGKGRPTWLYMPVVIERWHRARLDKALKAAEVDPMLGAGDSPALEQYRRARTELARLELQERQGKLVELAEFQRRFVPAANRLRQFARRLGRQCGRQWASELERVLVECEKLMQTEGTSGR